MFMRHFSKLFVFLGISSIAVFSFTSCNTAGGKNPSDNSISAIKVEVASVISVPDTGLFSYSGTVEPLRSIPLNFQVTGTISQVYVEEGQSVKSGQLLASLNKADLASANKTARATYQQAKDAYDRLKPVFENGSLTEMKWVEVTTGLDKAEGMLEISNSNLEKTELRAPESGIIGSRNAEPGMSSIQPQSPFTLVNIEKVFIKISVPEQEIPFIKTGESAHILVAALGSRLYDAKVHSVGVVANSISRTYEVKLILNNPSMDLKPGMICDVSLHRSATPKKVAVIPTSAVTTDKHGVTMVYILDRATMTVAQRTIVTGIFRGNNISVISGLESTDEVVVTGKEKINHNSHVAL